MAGEGLPNAADMSLCSEGNIRQIKDVSLDNPFRGDTTQTPLFCKPNIVIIALELIRFVEAPPHIPNLGQVCLHAPMSCL